MEQNSRQADERDKTIIHNTSTNDQTWCEKFFLRFHKADTSPSWEPRCWSKVFPFPFCPTYRQAAQQICIVIFFFFSWGILYANLEEKVGLHSEFISMTILVIAAYFIGWIWMRVTTLPGLIAMLLTGMLFQNLKLVHMTDQYEKLNQDSRKIALVIILTRAGLGLNANVLKKHYAVVLQLAFIPWVCEFITTAVFTHYLLNLPWIYGFLLGALISAAAPSVLVPILFRLKEAGYGEDKGIPTLTIAAAALDASTSVAVFGIILNAMFSSGSATYNIIKGPLSIVAGIVLGSLWGAMISIIPEKGDTFVVPLRFLALFLGGLFSLFVSSLIEWSGAGALAVVSSGFVAGFFWDKQGWPVNKNPVTNIFRILWIFFEPILFAFTGAQITISALDPQVIKMGLVCLISCLMIRGAITFIISFGCNLNYKEKLFIAITWVAKAAVQAALGPSALSLVHSGKTSGVPAETDEYSANAVLTYSVLSVVVTAPAGAILIALTGPWLLTQYQADTVVLDDVETVESIDAKRDDV